MNNNWKNKLGHDPESEILTIIARMRENLFKILMIEQNSFLFEIKLDHTILCNCVPLHSSTIANFIIKREDANNNLYDYTIQQLNGYPERKIKMEDGWIIWGLLDEKLDTYNDK